MPATPWNGLSDQIGFTRFPYRDGNYCLNGEFVSHFIEYLHQMPIFLADSADNALNFRTAVMEEYLPVNCLINHKYLHLLRINSYYCNALGTGVLPC